MSSRMTIEHRDALIYMLFEAAEIEHAICCQYLFAAFSLKEADEGLTEKQATLVEGWRKTLFGIAAEEMLHLATVNNLLTSIGAAPRVGRPNLPAQGRHYPPGIQFALMPFSEAALRHFLFLERPEGINLPDAEGFIADHDAEPVLSEDDIVPRPQHFDTIGYLYRSIEEGFVRLTERHGEEWLFIGDHSSQATPETFRWPALVPVHDLASARAAIDVVVEQGEGPRGRWQDAHYGRLLVVLGEFRTIMREQPSFAPALPVIAANCRPSVDAQALPLVTDPLTVKVMDLFNVSYEVLLYSLARYFAHGHETEEQLEGLAGVAVELMIFVIKPLGMMVTRLPVGADHPGQNAGPSFELFHGSGYLLPHTWQAWVLLHERLMEVRAFLERVLQEPGYPPEMPKLVPSIDRILGHLTDHMPRLKEREVRPPLSWQGDGHTAL
jgi:Ferritin-like